MEIAVLAGAGVVPPIEIVGKIKGAEVYGILMDYTALCVIFILYIDLTLEILNRTEIPVAVIRISGSCGCISSCLQKSQGGYREGCKVNFKDLLLRAKDGDQQAKEEIFLMYRPLLFKESCVNGIFDEDLFQELSATLIHCIRMFKL